MEMTRRQFALSIAAASSLRSSLFELAFSPLGVPRGVVPGRCPSSKSNPRNSRALLNR
jgi:hypothetical protein